MQIVTNEFQKELKKHGSNTFPILVSPERLSKYESGSFLWHWHPEIEITLIQQGQMIYKVNQCTFHLKEGEILFGNANVLHSGYMDREQDCRYISITFDPKLIYGFHDSIIYQNYVSPLTQDFSLPAICFDFSQAWHKQILAVVQNIIRLDKEKPDFYELDMMIALQTLWKTILQNYHPSVAYTPHDKLEHERVKEIMVYLEQNYMNKISLADISAHLHLCTSECSRLFKRYMNLSLFSFLKEYRIERSLEYLSDPSCPLTDIAARVGFTDSNYYSKVFTKVKGCSPQTYRKALIRQEP